VLDESDSEDGNSSDDESSSGSDDESSESESEDEREKRRRRAKRRRSRSGSRRSPSDKEERGITSRKRIVRGPHKEVENLIKQMNLLTQDDPQYGITYYRALKLDPDIAKIVAEPALRRPGDQRVVAARATTYPQARYSQTAKPAYYAPQVSSQPPLQPPPRGSEMTCYGCGEKGHGMSRCGVINEMISKDLLALDIAGRIVHKDGTPIR